jgi:UPF0755 protein
VKSGEFMKKKSFLATGKKLILSILLLALIIYPFISYNNFLKSPVSKDAKAIEFRVAKGESSNKVIDKLYEKKLIKNKLFAKIYFKLSNIDKGIRYGVYSFNTSMTPVDIFDKLQKGDLDPNVVAVTIPEGYTIRQIAERLFKSEVIKDVDGFIDEAQTGVFKYDFLKDIPSSRPSRLEGYLFPDTYEFKKDMSHKEIINKMLSRFESVYNSLISPKIDELKVSPDQLMIMASLVEKEAKVQSDRPIIAGVFYNRLKINMKLQSCATVQYVLGEPKEVLLYKDLEIESPYNTYKYTGLPVGPIGSPGMNSIEAALNPADVDYIYFVAKGDGSHYFASDYKEFLKHKNSLKN